MLDDVNGVSICNRVTWSVIRRTDFVLNENSTLDFHYDVVSWNCGRGAVVAVYCLRNTYIPTRLEPECHRLNWRDRNCSAPFQVISRFISNWIIYSPLQPTSHQHLCISHSVSVTEVSDVFVVKLLIIILHYIILYSIIFWYWDMRWRSCLRHCAKSRDVALSIPDGIIGIFHWHNPSGRTVSLRST